MPTKKVDAKVKGKKEKKGKKEEPQFVEVKIPVLVYQDYGYSVQECEETETVEELETRLTDYVNDSLADEMNAEAYIITVKLPVPPKFTRRVVINRVAVS